MCDLDSASVVEDHGGFQSINTAAHELGHRYDIQHIQISTILLYLYHFNLSVMNIHAKLHPL